MPWQRTKPRLNCIYRFDPRVESHVLANLEHELRVLIRNFSLVLGDNHFWSDVAVSDRSSLGLCDRLAGVSRHLECMLVLKGCAGAGTEVLANDAAKSEPLLEPVPSVDGELAYRGSWPDWNSTDRVAITDGEFAQERGHLRKREGRKTRQSDDAYVSSADARLESRDQVLIAENRVEVGRRSRYGDLVQAPVDATGEMREQSVHV